MLKYLIYAVIYILLFREVYAVVLYDLYGEKTEYRKKRERAAHQTDRPQKTDLYTSSQVTSKPASCSEV